MIQRLILITTLSSVAFAQTLIPDGTRLRLRLDQTLSSSTADQGQAVELSVTEAVKIDGMEVIPEGARATGTVVLAEEKKRMGRAGKLDFSVDRVRAADGEWIPIRYTVNKKQGDSRAVSTGVMTAGVAVVFWPAAPFLLLRHGKDVQINKGITIDVFTDSNHKLSTAKAGGPVAPAPQSVETGTLSINSAVSSAEVEINGNFYGNVPATVKLPAGQYNVVVKQGARTWERSIQVGAGSSLALNATFAESAARR